MTARVAHTVLQLIAAISMTAGVFLLFGVPWALFTGGFALLVGSVASEAAAPRAGER